MSLRIVHSHLGKYDMETGENILLKSQPGQEAMCTPTPKKLDLHRPVAVRRELATVYRDMRSGKIKTQDGTRLAYVLDMIRKSFETEILERRVVEIEAVLKLRRGGR